MGKKEILGGLTAISLMSILFTPTDSDVWRLFLVLGLSTGIAWFYKS
ncbi:MAG: hypothetical protein ABEI74_04500 [Candidatus Pacearchaeota archaeon]